MHCQATKTRRCAGYIRGAGIPPRFDVGISVEPIEAKAGSRIEKRLKVTGVDAGSPAEKDGMKVGDVLTRVTYSDLGESLVGFSKVKHTETYALEQPDDWYAAVQASPDGKMRLTYFPAGKSSTRSMTLSLGEPRIAPTDEEILDWEQTKKLGDAKKAQRSKAKTKK